MFRRIEVNDRTAVGVVIDGMPFQGQAGDTVAAVLLAAGKRMFRRSAVAGEPRGPFCMMGVCFECLVEIDGVPNRQGCLIPVTEGMRIVTGGRQTEARQ